MLLGMKDQVNELVGKCDICQRQKVFRAEIHEPMLRGEIPLELSKNQKFFFAQIDWKTIQKYNPKVLLVIRKLNGTYFFMYKNFEARFLETNFFYPAVKIQLNSTNYSTDLLEWNGIL